MREETGFALRASSDFDRRLRLISNSLWTF